MTSKHIRGFLICCWLLVTGICGVLLYMAFRPTPMENGPFICGNTLMDNNAAYRSDSAFADGKAVFQNNCASCHNPLKDATGPALADINSFRSQEWICRFLTKPTYIPSDKRAINLRKQYGLKCMKFPQLSCKELEAAVKYIDHYKSAVFTLMLRKAGIRNANNEAQHTLNQRP